MTADGIMQAIEEMDNGERIKLLNNELSPLFSRILKILVIQSGNLSTMVHRYHRICKRKQCLHLELGHQSFGLGSIPW